MQTVSERYDRRGTRERGVILLSLGMSGLLRLTGSLSAWIYCSLARAPATGPDVEPRA